MHLQRVISAVLTMLWSLRKYLLLFSTLHPSHPLLRSFRAASSAQAEHLQLQHPSQGCTEGAAAHPPEKANRSQRSKAGSYKRKTVGAAGVAAFPLKGEALRVRSRSRSPLITVSMLDYARRGGVYKEPGRPSDYDLSW
jgi:hypothetical protein